MTTGSSEVSPNVGEERVLCRARVCDREFMGGGFGMEHAYRKVWGEAIVTDRRLMAKWDDGRVDQYLLTQIRTVDFGEPRKEPLGDRNYTRRFKQDYPGIQRIRIFTVTDRAPVEWDSVSARQMASAIQDAMMPF
jgi:hypothetical protein